MPRAGKTMRTCDQLRTWFSLLERAVIFTFGLLFSKGMVDLLAKQMITFLTDVWNLRQKEALAISNLRDGLKDMLQILVALCIDACFGDQWMLILSALLYSSGLGILAFSVPQQFFKGEKVCPLENVHCFKKLQYTPFWGGLTLLILGGAAQIIPLDSLSFDQTKVEQTIIRWFCYGFLMLGTITSVFSSIFLKHKWQQRFLLSAIAIANGLLWFLCGFPFHGPRLLQPSPLSTMLRELIAAVRKKPLNCQPNPGQLHHGDGEERASLTKSLEWLNRAAVKESHDYSLTTEETMRWGLCTVKEVEQTKLLLRIIPMSATFIMYGMVKTLGNTFFVEEADSITGGIPIVVLQIIRLFSEDAAKRGYKMVFEKRIERLKGRFSDGVKIGLGMLASVIYCTVASFVETKRLNLIKQGPSGYGNATASISALLVPQFPLLGAMGGLAGEGIQDFFSHYAPDSRRYVPVFATFLTGLGTLLNMVFLRILDYYSKSKYNASWLGDSINQSRLDYIYRAYVMLALLNCLLYAYAATRYSYDNIIGRPNEDETTGGERDQQNNQGPANFELQRISGP